MSTTSSTPGSFQLIEAVVERLDGAPIGERRRWSDEFKAQAVAAAMAPDVNVSALARRLGICRRNLMVDTSQERHAVIQRMGQAIRLQ